jgi:hypothetical protein
MKNDEWNTMKGHAEIQDGGRASRRRGDLTPNYATYASVPRIGF